MYYNYHAIKKVFFRSITFVSSVQNKRKAGRRDGGFKQLSPPMCDSEKNVHLISPTTYTTTVIDFTYNFNTLLFYICKCKVLHGRLQLAIHLDLLFKPLEEIKVC